MGTWGMTPFENDGALDWLLDLQDAEDASLIEETFESALEDDEIVEGDDELVAAAEVVAAWLGHPAGELPEEVTAFLETMEKRKPSKRLVGMATRVVRRLLKSEAIRGKWEETDDLASWEQGLQDLLGRLGT